MAKRKNQIIFCVMFAAYTSIYIARLNLSIAGPEMIKTSVIDAAQIGILGSIFSTVFAIGRLINGFLSDSAPPWRMLTIGLGVVGISNICIGAFPPVMGMFVLWGANAFAQSMLWSAILCVITSVFDEKSAKRKMAIMITSVSVGNILGIVLNTFFVMKFGVKYAFCLPGFITLLLGVAAFLTTRHIKINSGKTENHISVFGLFKNREILKMSIPAMLHGVMKENVSLWMTAFVIDTYAVDLTTSAYYILLIPICGFIGRIAYPPIYKACSNSENKVSQTGFAVCIAVAAILCIGHTGILTAVLALGIIYTAVSVINTSILSIYPLNFADTGNSASVSGVMDLATYMGAGISSVAYGYVIKHMGYTPMFMSWAIISAVSVWVLKNNKISKARRS